VTNCGLTLARLTLDTAQSAIAQMLALVADSLAENTAGGCCIYSSSSQLVVYVIIYYLDHKHFFFAVKGIASSDCTGITSLYSCCSALIQPVLQVKDMAVWWSIKSLDTVGSNRSQSMYLLFCNVLLRCRPFHDLSLHSWSTTARRAPRIFLLGVGS
jgi:hypothetical protein